MKKQRFVTDDFLKKAFPCQGIVARTEQQASLPPIRLNQSSEKYGGGKRAKMKLSISRNTLGFKFRDF